MRRVTKRSVVPSQVADTPQEIPFLSVLQHLLRLDRKDAASDLAWDTAETLVHRATLLESREDATKLLRSPSLQVNARALHSPAIWQFSVGKYSVAKNHYYFGRLSDFQADNFVCGYT